MKRVIVVVLCFCFYFNCYAQSEQIQSREEQLFETVSEEELVPDQEGELQEVDYLRRHPLDLNLVTEEGLRLFRFLSAVQIKNFLLYRSTLGKLVHLYELQAIPGWDKSTIQHILPFVAVRNSSTILSTVKTGIQTGEQVLLMRYGRHFFGAAENKNFLGSPGSLLIKYSLRSKKDLRMGITGDKDAGEIFFRGKNRTGFDFYSAHLFLQPRKLLHSLAIGDFVVQLGQGLIQWQGLAFGKSSETMNISRQGPILKPYTSAGEYNFHRGVAVQLKKKNWELLSFISYRKFSANLIEDTISGSRKFSTIQISGYHRTEAELEDKYRLRMFTNGTAINYLFSKGKLGLHYMTYQLSDSLQKETQPYNYYSFSGRRLQNLGADIKYTYRNLHVFGELAVDHRLSYAAIAGMLMTVGGGLDFSALFRRFGKDYHSFFSNSFSEWSTPANEKGLYLGCQFRPNAFLRINGYADFFKSDWVRFGSRGPVGGVKYLLQLNYDPSKTVSLYVRWRDNRKTGQSSTVDLENRARSIRVHFQQKFNRTWEWKTRVEMVWLKNESKHLQQGSLFFVEGSYEPMMSSIAASFRLLYFNTEGFDTRLYAFEPDVLYSYNIPAYYNTGLRWVANAKLKLHKPHKISNINNVTIWVKLAQTIEKQVIANTNPIINQLKFNELEMRVQAVCRF